jgi:hypothetical protein
MVEYKLGELRQATVAIVDHRTAFTSLIASSLFVSGCVRDSERSA